MGKMSRTKGCVFERKIARVFRAAWPDTVVRRASQAERAHNPDVFIESGPTWLRHLWLELQDARQPNPLAKLEQAERDVDAKREPEGVRRIPVVIWHRIHEKTVHATLRASMLDVIRGNPWGDFDSTPLTLTLDDLITILRRNTP